MQLKSLNIKLMGMFLLTLGVAFVVERWCIYTQMRTDVQQMNDARVLADRWYRIVSEMKQELGIYHQTTRSGYDALLGDEYTEITTTLGSIEAKTAAANPAFSAMIVRMLDDAGVDSTETVGIALSGSFPSLSIAVLAAVQTIGAKAVIISSLGASSYGANQPQATWLDIERWLSEKGGLRLRSNFVTYGAEGDSGGGLSGEGKNILDRAIERNHADLFLPSSFDEAVKKRVRAFRESKISILINIGGNQTSLGNCSHATTIPNGFHQTLRSCTDPERGILVRMTEFGVPVIHLLYINDLAARYGLPLIPDRENDSGQLYSERTVRRIPAISLTIILLISLFLLGKGSKTNRNQGWVDAKTRKIER